MRYWLFKSEPESWSWEDQLDRGEAGQGWDGVRNYGARNNMRAMRRGDRGFFYHSGGVRAIVGLVEIVAEAHPDSTAEAAAWDCVDIRALAALPRPVTLDAVKGEPRLREMALVKNARLSVQPVSQNEWRLICDMGGLTGA